MAMPESGYFKSSLWKSLTDTIQIVAINDLGKKEINAHLTRYASTHGNFLDLPFREWIPNSWSYHSIVFRAWPTKSSLGEIKLILSTNAQYDLLIERKLQAIFKQVQKVLNCKLANYRQIKAKLRFALFSI